MKLPYKSILAKELKVGDKIFVHKFDYVTTDKIKFIFKPKDPRILNELMIVLKYGGSFYSDLNRLFKVKI